MVFTALIMGLTGSLHCVGMCSPLAMAVGNMNTRAFLNRAIYNAGRIVTYGLLGLGIAGVGLALPISKFQNLVSILLAIILLLAGIGLLKVNIPIFSKAIAKLTSTLKKLFTKFLNRKNFGSVFLLGTLNGILPCGLVWIALTYSLTLQSPLEGFSFMMLFGVGTLPVMLGFTSIVTQMLRRFNFNFQYITSAMLILSGILLIVRVFIIHLPHQHSIQQGVVDIVLCTG
jgi:sulfite exporter TauE/SafE